jgi:hypothetical protein
VSVTGVRKDPDGSYDVLGTRAGNQVMFDVSADLKSITENAGHAGPRRTPRPACQQLDKLNRRPTRPPATPLLDRHV